MTYHLTITSLSDGHVTEWTNMNREETITMFEKYNELWSSINVISVEHPTCYASSEDHGRDVHKVLHSIDCQIKGTPSRAALLAVVTNMSEAELQEFYYTRDATKLVEQWNNHK